MKAFGSIYDSIWLTKNDTDEVQLFYKCKMNSKIPTSKLFLSLSIIPHPPPKTYEQTKTANFIHDRFFFPRPQECSLPSKT